MDVEVDEQDVPVVLAPAWNDRMWDEVWERTIGRVERHRIAMMLVRREEPQDALAMRLLPELARRWRRTCLWYAIGWGSFALFFIAVGVAAETHPEGGVVVTPWWMGMLGLAVVTVALSLRHWIRDVAPTRRR